MRRVKVIAGLLALLVLVLVPELMELLELGQLLVDPQGAWKTPS